MSRNEPGFAPLELGPSDDHPRSTGSAGRRDPGRRKLVILASILVASLLGIALVVGLVVIGRKDRRGYENFDEHTNPNQGTPASGGTSGPTTPDAQLDQLGKMTERNGGVMSILFSPGIESKVLLEFPESLLGRLFLVNTVFGSGDGEKVLYHSGIQDKNNWFQFQWSPSKETVDLMQPQFDVRVDHSSPLEEAFVKGINAPHIRGAFKPLGVKAAEKADGSAEKVYLLDISSWLQSGFTIIPGEIASSSIFRLLNVSTYEHNIEFEIQMIIRPLDLEVSKIHFSLALLPEVPYQARVADDRLGFFTTDYINFGANRTDKARVQLVHRWRLEKKDPAQAISDPIKQIKYYVDPSVPPMWRPYVKKGIENWQKAFTKAGFSNAIRGVLPTDSDWPADYDAGDIRYSTISWVPDLAETFGLGPSDVDPRSGEILNADILITSGWTTYYEEMVVTKGLERSTSSTASMDTMRHVRTTSSPSFNSTGRPQWADVLASIDDQAGPMHRYSRQEHDLLHATLLSGGAVSMGDNLPVEFAGAGLTDVVMHEVGHTLGLRHNFKGSLLHDYANLGDVTKTKDQGLVSTVMDYTAVYIPSDASKRGEYFTSTVGPYDLLAIQYGYSQVNDESAGKQSPSLVQLAQQAQAQGLAFATDEDIPRSSGGDPYCSVFDIGKNPLDFYEDRNKLVRSLWTGLKDRVTDIGENYLDFLRAAQPLMSAPALSAMYAAKFLGGYDTSKVHKDSSGNNRAPLKAVDAADQNRALALIIAALTGDLLIPPQGVYPYLVQREEGSLQVAGFDVHNEVARLRMKVLGSLFTGSRVARLRNTQWGFGASNALGLAEIVDRLTAAIFDKATFAPSWDHSFIRDTQVLWLEFCMPIMPRDSDLDSVLIAQLTVIKDKITADFVNQPGYATAPAMIKAHLNSIVKKISVFDSTGQVPPGLGPAIQKDS